MHDLALSLRATRGRRLAVPPPAHPVREGEPLRGVSLELRITGQIQRPPRPVGALFDL